MTVLLGKDMEEDEATDKSVKRFIRKVMDKRRRMDNNARKISHEAHVNYQSFIRPCIYT